MVTKVVITLKCGFNEKEEMVPRTVQPQCRLGENIKIGYNCFFTSPDVSTLIKVVEYQASEEGLSCDSVEITNKMQPCNRIYYSTVH